MNHAPRIFIIVGSTRARRICPQVAAWVAEVGEKAILCMIEVVDLKDWPLPMDDEPGIPAGGVYAHDHTRAWSRKIADADGFVFVSPQYNCGYPAPLKNALDHLYSEWSRKPAMIVTYGGHGGGKCADQLRQVLDGLKMETVATMPGLWLSRAFIEANAGAINPAREFAGQLEILLQAYAELGLVFSSKFLQKSRV